MTAEFIALLFFLSPIVFVLASGTYSEAFIALDLICALSVLKKENDPGGLFLCGFLLAGPAAAVKLTGFFAAAAVLIYGSLLRRFTCRTFLLFILGTGFYALPFYLRPMLAAGNPCWPYLGAWFSETPAVIEMSAFHHVIGKSYFGTGISSGVFTTPLLLALSGYKNLFDGFYGLPLFPAFSLLFYYLVCRRKRFRKFLPGLSAGIFLYSTWYFSAPQARFLLPFYLLMLTGLFYALQNLRKKTCIFSMILMTVLALYSLKDEVFWRNTISRFARWRNPVDLFYNEMHDDHLLFLDLLRQIQQKRVMLFFEERTLYLPCSAVIATPFFQSAYFTPPDRLTPEKLLSVIEKEKIELIYFRLPENNPDLSKEHLDRCKVFFDSIGKLKMRRVPVGKSGFLLITAFSHK